MKRMLCALLICVMLIGIVPLQTSAVYDDGTPPYMRFQLRSIDITITRDQELKIGSHVYDTQEGWNVSFTTPSGSTELTYCAAESALAVIPGSGNNSYLTTSNTLQGTLCFECYLMSGNDGEVRDFSVTVNGSAVSVTTEPGDMSIRLSQDFSTPPTYAEDGAELYRYILEIPISVPYELPDNPVYYFYVADNPLISYYSLDNMPIYAEAGASVHFWPVFAPTGINAQITDILANGESQGTEFKWYTMPAEDVYLDVVIDGGKNASNQTVVKDLNITLDFPEDIYYGRVLPTEQDLKKALSFSTSVSGAGLYLDWVEVANLVDDTLSETMDPWVGNTMLSFTIRAKDGYIFSDSSIPDWNEMAKWMDENVSVTINGKRNYYNADNGEQYYDGYFIPNYYTNGINGIEVHVFWYGSMEVDMDTSRFKAGDTVTIPDNCFDYDGYVPYRYDYIYTAPDGEIYREKVYGNTFIHPQTDGTPIQIYTLYIRGEDKTPAQNLTQDAGQTIELNTDRASFPSGTILSANLIKPKETGGQATIDHVKKALAGHGSDCMVLDISASSFNQAVQPDGTVLVQFDIPEGYDEKYIDFCYISEDGKMERVPMTVDPSSGKCTAALEHFSLYAIVKTLAQTEHEDHILHTVTEVAAIAPTCTDSGSAAYYTCACGKWFYDAAATKEITDQECIILPATHVDADGNGECDLCGAEVELIAPPDTDDVPDTPVEPDSGESPAPDATESTQVIAGAATAPAAGIQRSTSSGDGSPALLWIILAAVILLGGGAVALLLILHRKRK